MKVGRRVKEARCPPESIPGSLGVGSKSREWVAEERRVHVSPGGALEASAIQSRGKEAGASPKAW